MDSDDLNCVKCQKKGRKLAASEKKLIITQEFADEVTNWLYETLEVGDLVNRVVCVGSFLCLKCYSKLARDKSNKKRKLEDQQQQLEIPVSEMSQLFSQSTTEASSSQSSTNDPTVRFNPEPEPTEVVELPIQRTVSTHKYCCLCGCNATKNLVQISFEARSQAYSRMQIFIPQSNLSHLLYKYFLYFKSFIVFVLFPENRCCKKHLTVKNRFYEDDLRQLSIYSNSSIIEVSELTKLLKGFSARVDRNLFDRIPDFSIPEKSLMIFTGLNWEQLIQLREMMTILRSSHNRDVTQALIVFLLKLRSGNSNNMIAAILGIEWSQRISDFVNSVMRSFKVDVLPSRFGIHATSREDLIAHHTTAIAQKLHNLGDDQLMLIGDGTYLRHQKSSNNNYQRRSYSGQKKCHLTKPFTLCMPDGFVVDVLGPFEANLNDAQILQHLLENNEELAALLQANDVFVLDRGFRDVVPYLNDKGYKVLMPSLKNKKNQLSREEANHSRFVTKIRWAIEAVHGVVGQKNKLLHHQFDNKALYNAKWYCQVACFLNNFFGKRFHSDIDMTDEIVDRMKQQSQVENTLAKEVEEGRWRRRQNPFSDLTSEDLDDFPETTERDLKILFTGCYQLKQAVSYLAEMLDINGVLNLKFLKETPQIIRVPIRSRHINSKTYNCFVEYSPQSTGYRGIKRWCCECANGLRTIGCCSHVAAVVYYLSCGRFKSKLLNPSQILSNLFVEDDTMPVIDDDSDYDD